MQQGQQAKVTIVGAGEVGVAIARSLATQSLAQVVLVDHTEGLAAGRALDLTEAAPLENQHVAVLGTDNYADTVGSDVIVLASGVSKRPSLSRDKFLETNVKITAEAVARSVAHSPEAVLVILSGPVEALSWVAARVSGFPPQRVIGAGMLVNSARYRAFIAAEVGCSPADVTGLVLGGQGDLLQPLPRCTSVAGIPVTQLVSPGRLEEIVTRTRNGAAEVSNLVKSGPAFTPASAAVAVTAAVLRDEHRLLPVTAYCDGEYGLDGVFVGVPAVVGAAGVLRIVEVELDARERETLAACARNADDLCEQAGKHLPQ